MAAQMYRKLPAEDDPRYAEELEIAKNVCAIAYLGKSDHLKLMSSLCAHFDCLQRALTRQVALQYKNITLIALQTISSVLVFILAMVLHPEVTKKAQEEIDRVVGRDRLPDFSDKEKLVYISAITKETMRWEGVAPIGLSSSYRLYQRPNAKF